MSAISPAVAKADPLLREALARPLRSGETLPVILTLAPAPAEPPTSPRPNRATRQRRARETAEAFERGTASLVSELEAHGARDIERQWISRTVSGRMSPAAIDAAARRPEVIRLALVVPRDVLL